MAASVSGSKTVTNDVSPNLTASVLTTLLAIAPENFTIAQLRLLWHALDATSGGHEPTNVVGTLLV